PLGTSTVSGNAGRLPGPAAFARWATEAAARRKSAGAIFFTPAKTIAGTCPRARTSSNASRSASRNARQGRSATSVRGGLSAGPRDLFGHVRDGGEVGSLRADPVLVDGG